MCYLTVYCVTNLTVLHPVYFPTPYPTTNITYIYTATRTLNYVQPSVGHKTRTEWQISIFDL